MKRRFSVICRLSLLLTLLSALILLALMMAVDDSLKTYLRESNRADQDKLTEVARRQLEHDAQLLLRSLSDSLRVDIYNQDFSAIGDALERLGKFRNLDYIYVYDHNGSILHDGSADVPLYGEPITSHTPPQLLTGLVEGRFWSGEHLHLNSRVEASGEAFAAITAGFDFTSAFNEIKAHREDMISAEYSLFQNVRKAVLLTFMILLPICMLSAIWITRGMLKPLQVLTNRSSRYAEGERNLTFELHRPDEFGRLGTALERMRQALEESHDQVRQMAYEDTVTNLPNRRWFQNRLSEMMHRSASLDGTFAVLFIDLDHFKQVNDTAGHERGDQLLREVSKRLQTCVQANRLQRGPAAELARLGGDEFVVLLPAIQSAEDAAETARALLGSLAPPFLLYGQYFSISCSIGITLYPDDGISASEILKHADVAMYSAKQHGRNQFAFFQPQMTEEIREHLEIQQGIKEAIDKDYLYLDYQPLYSMESGQMIGAEALLRWRHPIKGLLSPARFIPIIEESDLIEDVTRWVANRAARDLKKILDLREHFSVAINISGAALHQLEMCEYICELKQHLALPDKTLSIEITETSMISHLDSCEAVLRRWKRAGIDIWIDDFGTGYSSLAYLNSLSIDGLKIDQSFVHNLIDGHSRPLIDAMIALADSLSIGTVAEGIETDRQHEELKAMGVEYGQGFGLARPMRIDALMQLLETEENVRP
ncbi:putative bifunctional diguanylate cyclase/phosphodiesterase [Marinobacterium mangrovicola]|uniref:Diguanylate cyclase/phosphodiesterase n=1 Tax=Marinobacterium mangrovicola TaxID=1476959 RepID=A0A4R1GA14_9GAMM|nr:EAL domain-containing protein [Marinobacterium mangrovicola]TCK03521.1 diguanylate cyclase/phosphodiesterase [Marinobacterium mangrovicola]